MQSQPTEPPGNGICVAHGYGLKVYVHRGHLIVHDGIGRQRRTRRYHRATSKLRRVVLIGHTGYITLDALRWLRDTGAALLHIEADGQLLTTSAVPGYGQAGLRRAQALASESATGVEIARDLLLTKVTGQASLLPELPGGNGAQDAFDSAIGEIREAPGIPALLRAEAQAAGAYWGAWADVPIQLGRHPGLLPDHWQTFGQRHSLLTSSPRQACNPANAILNYLYALLEAETTIACHAVGLDPTLGIFHTDQRSRPSLALDAMEAVRPIVDAYVLALLIQRTLHRADFCETRQGGCRITPGLAGRLADTITSWRHHIAPVAEGVAQALAKNSTRPVAIGAPLTRAQHQAAWNERAPARKQHHARGTTPILQNGCRDCGENLPDRRRRYCEPCRAERWTQNASAGRDSAAAVLAALRAELRDPAHGGRAAEARGSKNAVHQAAVRAWRGEVPDPESFRREILPALQARKISDLVAATGLSEHYCSLIRLGKRIPHVRHWQALRCA